MSLNAVAFSSKDLIALLDAQKQLMLYDPSLPVGDRYQRILASNAVFSAPNEVKVQTEADLETEFGSNIEIPLDSRVTIVLDDAFNPTKQIKVGENVTLEIYASTIGTRINFTTAGLPWITLLDPTKPAESIVLHNFSFIGNATNSTTNNGTNSLCDIKCDRFLLIDDIPINNCFRMGVGDAPIFRIRGFSPTNCSTGFVVKNPLLMQASGNIVNQGLFDINFTLLSFIGHPNFPGHFDLKESANFLGATPTTSLYFFDPNFVIGTTVIVTDNAKGSGQLYQIGTGIVISTATDNGSGKVRFTTATQHNLVVGQIITLSGFLTQTTYNKTVIITAVDTPITGTTFDVDEIAFLGNDQGIISAQSLIYSDVRIDARGNIDEPESQALGAGFVNGNTNITSILGMNSFQDLDFGTLIPSIAMQEFILSDPLIAEFTYIGRKTRILPLTMSITAKKTGGSTQIYRIKFQKDEGSGYADFDDNIVLPLELKTTILSGTYVCEAVLSTGDKVKPVGEGVNTTDDIIIDSASITMK